MALGDVTIIAPGSIQGDDTKLYARSKSIGNGFGVMSTTNRDLIHADVKAGGYGIYNTTTNQLERWDGAAWVAIVGFGGGGIGFRFTYSTTTTDADPGAGTFRGNNATLSSVTTLYVDLTEYGGTDITAWLDSLDDTNGGAKGIIRFQSLADSTKWIEYLLTAWTTATGYRKLTVAYLAGPGGLSTTAGDTFLSFDAIGYTGTVPVASGGTGITSISAANRVLASTDGSTFTTTQIVDAMVASAAAIAGSKIVPDFTAAITTTGTSILFGVSVVAPTIGQTTLSGVTVVGASMTYTGQDVVGSTSAIAGTTTIRGADASGAGGVRTAGNLVVRSGIGLVDGNLILQRGAVIVGQWVGTSSDFIALGNGPATTGQVRLGNGNGSANGIQFRSNGSSNLYGLAMSSSNVLVLGELVGHAHTITTAAASGAHALLLTGNTLFQVVDLGSGRYVTGFGSAVTTTQMPTNTGNRVLYLAEATTVPTADAVGGAILYTTGISVGGPSFSSFCVRSGSGGGMGLGDGSTPITYVANATGHQFVSGGSVVLLCGGAGLGFFGATAATQAADPVALTATSGSADNTIADVGASFNQSTLNDNFKDLATKYNLLRDVVRRHGLAA